MSQQTAETLENRMVNGVDVGRLFETIDAVKGEPGIARFKFRSTNRWINGGNNQARINGFYGALQEHSRETDFELEIDEPPVLLGEDKGAQSCRVPAGRPFGLSHIVFDLSCGGQGDNDTRSRIAAGRRPGSSWFSWDIQGCKGGLRKHPCVL